MFAEDGSTGEAANTDGNGARAQAKSLKCDEYVCFGNKSVPQERKKDRKFQEVVTRNKIANLVPSRKHSCVRVCVFHLAPI